MPVRWTFNFHAHCSNGFPTCKTGEIIDAQACLAKPPRWKARERKTCQQTSLVPGSLGRGHSMTVAQNKAAWPKSRAITNIQQLARMPPRLSHPHMPRCQYQYRPAPAVAVCCCDHAASCSPRVKRTAVPFGPACRPAAAMPTRALRKLFPKQAPIPAAGIIKTTRISRELT